MDKWPLVVLDEVVEFVSDKINVENLSLANYVSTENMLPDKGGVVPAERLPPQGRVHKFVPGDILFSNIRTYFKKIWHASIQGGASPDLIVFRPKSFQKITTRYLYYLLSNDDFIDLTVKASKGTKMPRGDKDAMRGYQFFLPPIPIQQRIADILSAYDELIENNQRRIHILEDMARSLYREWFVHFRYPGHESVPLVDSPLGPIPEGWELKSLAHLMKISGGSQPPKSEFVYQPREGFVRLIQIRDYESDNNLTFVRESPKLRRCRRTDILIARYGASVARICSGLEGAYNVALAKVIPLFPNSQEFLRQFLSADEFQKLLIGMSGRAAQNGFNKSDIAAVNLPVPTDRQLFEKFEQITAPIRASVLGLKDKNRNLRKTRDLLLPRLISGQITLPVTLAGVENDSLPLG